MYIFPVVKTNNVDYYYLLFCRIIFHFYICCYHVTVRAEMCPFPSSCLSLPCRFTDNSVDINLNFLGLFVNGHYFIQITNIVSCFIDRYLIYYTDCSSISIF